MLLYNPTVIKKKINTIMIHLNLQGLVGLTNRFILPQ